MIPATYRITAIRARGGHRVVYLDNHGLDKLLVKIKGFCDSAEVLKKTPIHKTPGEMIIISLLMVKN